jgi:NAD(P)-dependent dehydrogenase (short-subunit alcohol dehydrogenase family)
MIKLPNTPSFSLAGRRGLVIGGTSGIGLGCAVALAEAGASVTIMARRKDMLDDVISAMTAAGFAAEGIVADISDIEAMKTAIMGIRPLDILVNSAGMARHAPAIDTDPVQFDAVMNVNLRGAFFASTAAAQAMIDDGRTGSIINISSQMAVVGGIDRSVYAASKHAVEGFTKSMAIELGPHGIRVNTICPTFVRTPLTEQTFSQPARVKWIEDKIKLNRVGEVEDIMGAVQFLASDASSLVTGCALMIDGGMDSRLMPRENATSIDVARRAGVSQSAVSRVFTPGASASRQTVEKVRKAAAELGYRPNSLARAMVSGRSRIIGLVVAYLQNQFYPEALEKLSAALQSRGYHVLVFLTAHTQGDITDVIEEILDYQVDGIIAASVALSSELAERCQGRRRALGPVQPVSG